MSKDANLAEVRPAHVEEADEILTLWRASEAHPTITDTLFAVRRLISEQPEGLLVAELDGYLVGTIIAGWDGWRGSLYRLAVLPQHRRRGVARALAEDALRRFRSRGIERVSAYVVEADQVAVAFWSSLTEMGIIPDPAPKVRYVASLT